MPSSPIRSRKRRATARPSRGGSHRPLLIEVLTEELPPKALSRLIEAFSKNIVDGLIEKNLLAPGAEPCPYATPRRLAVLVTKVLDKQLERVVERKGPAVAAGLDASGQPTPALLGFAKSCGVSVAKLGKRSGDKGEYFVYASRQKGERLERYLAAIVESALVNLPVPKLMRWGAGEVQFVRPVHGIILLHGKKVLPGVVLGLPSGDKTHGHRFLSHGAITISRAGDYEKILKHKGKVIASFEVRREMIVKMLDRAAKKVGRHANWRIGKNAELEEEVTSLVEHPVVLAGQFDQEFLSVPRECLIISMQQHQKYFPLADKSGKLLAFFLFVSNMNPSNPKAVIQGNERVLRARLFDAKFFYDQDRKTSLADRVPRLADVVYHHQLGSQLKRTQRLSKLSVAIARHLKADEILVERAASLCKADLLTDMVGEFPELQGIMGRYYSRHEGEAAEVAAAIEQHYYPRTAGGVLPKHPIAVCVALADKLDTLAGIYGIGLVPTGEKDPYGLRRAALGVVRILAEKSLPLDVLELLSLAASQFPDGVITGSVASDLHVFMLERLKPYLREKKFKPDEIDAVLAPPPTRLDQVLPRLEALKKFRALPQAEALAAANKRIRNILRQAGGVPALEVNVNQLSEPAERKLSEAVQKLERRVAPLIKAGNYTETLKHLAGLRPVVDEFFDKVMVMVDDAAVRHNRLALLNRLSNLFLHVADISRLQS